MQHQLINETIELAPQEERVLCDMPRLTRTGWICGAIKSDQTVTLRTTFGSVGPEPISVADYEITDAEQFEFRATTSTAKIELIGHATETANVLVEVMLREDQ